MSLALPIGVGVVAGLLLGGRLGRLAELELRAAWVFLVAIALQLVAFPPAFVPWETHGTAASALWLLSYGLLLVGACLNRRIVGVPIVAAGMLLNLVAIAANSGTMPVTPPAMNAAGESYSTSENSTAMADPNVAWLVDRWAAPDWIPLANVFSVGDVVIAVGAVVLVLAAMGARLPRSLGRREAVG
jgi:hypothetical protein